MILNMILNGTQHEATPAQTSAGVVDLPTYSRERLCRMLTMDECPSPVDLRVIVKAIARFLELNCHRLEARDHRNVVKQVMIGGAPWIMGSLERELINIGIEPIFAFSRRESVDEQQADGSVIKRQIFRHIDFVRPYANIDA